MAITDAEFRAAVKDVHGAKSASQAQLLSLYAHFKQATEGDVKGKQPSRMNFRARAKYDSWAKVKGYSTQRAMEGYMRTANEMLGRKAKL